MYVHDEQELTEIPWDSFFLRGVDKGMGELGVPWDHPELAYDEETGEDVTYTEEQEDAFNEYEDAYNRIMEAGQDVIEAFGFISTYGRKF